MDLKIALINFALEYEYTINNIRLIAYGILNLIIDYNNDYRFIFKIFLVDINECLSSPCQNNGTCNNLSNKYTCTCAPGYEGTNCQTGMEQFICQVNRLSVFSTIKSLV